MGNKCCYPQNKSRSFMDCICLRENSSPEQAPINEKKLNPESSSTNNDQNDEATTVQGSNYDEILYQPKAPVMQQQIFNKCYQGEQQIINEEAEEDSKLLTKQDVNDNNENINQNFEQQIIPQQNEITSLILNNQDNNLLNNSLSNQIKIIKEQEQQAQEQQNENTLTKIENQIENKICYVDTNEQIMCKLNQALEDVKQKIYEDLSLFEKVYEEKEKGTQLCIYMRHYKLENYNVAVFRQEWIIPCSAKQMMDFKNNFEIQRTMDNNMDQFYIVEKFGEQNEYIKLYLRYKKVLFASPRDFLYTKHFRKICDEPETWGDVSQSVRDDANYPIYQGIERGRNILCGNFIENINDHQCKMRTYSEINLNLTLPIFMTKSASVIKMKDHVNRCYDYITKQLTQEKDIKE